MSGPSIGVTCEGDAYLEDFDEEDIVEYLRGKGYGVVKGGPDDRETAEHIPVGAKNFDDYARQFCKLNNLPLVGISLK